MTKSDSEPNESEAYWNLTVHILSTDARCPAGLCGTLTRAHASPSACKSSATRTTEQAPESGSVHRFCTSLLRQHLPPCSRALPLALHCLYSGIVKETFVVFVWGLEAYAPDDPRRRLEKDAGDTADDAHQIHRGRQMRRSGAPEAAAAASRPLAQSVAFLGHTAQPNLCRKPRWRGCHCPTARAGPCRTVARDALAKSAHSKRHIEWTSIGICDATRQCRNDKVETSIKFISRIPQVQQ